MPDHLPPLPPTPTGRYRHYKGGEYEVIGVARHSETHEPLVVYRPLYNDSGWWVRPHAMFFETVTAEGLTLPRFAPVSDQVPAAANLDIRIDDLTGSAIRALLVQHLRHMHEVSPPESVHALDIDALRRPDVTFWTAWDGAALLGCGALRALSPQHAEVKSMRTADAQRGRGVAAAVLRHLVAEARRRGYGRLSLETGSQPAFRPARRLYHRFGFEECAPFGDYAEDPHSIFMTRELAA